MSDTPQITIARVGREAHETLVNLFELYLHDMAEWFVFDTHPNGRYDYDLARHWDAGDRVYFASLGEIPIGFALVGAAPDWLDDPTANDVAEFFVVRRHRHSGVSDALARAVWDADPGRWRVRVFEGNLPAVPFWRRIVGSYSNGTHSEERLLNNGKHWAVFSFTNAPT